MMDLSANRSTLTTKSRTPMTTTDPPTIQIAIDAADPHAQNRFWAAALHYELEDHHDQIEQLLAAGAITADDTIEIDGRMALGPRRRLPRPRRARARACCSSTCRSRRRSRTASTSTSTTSRATTPGRPRSPGSSSSAATRLWDGQQGPQRWVTIADPEGNEFCVA